MRETAYEQAQVYLIYLMLITMPEIMVCRMKTKSASGKLLAALIVFAMSLSLAWLLILLCNFMYVLNGLFIITLTVSAGLMVFLAYRMFTEQGPNRTMTALFIGYCAAIFAVTLFARIGISNNAVYVDVLRSLADALTLRDPEKTEHLLLNTAMFVPLGALYMMTTPSERQLGEDDKHVIVRYGSAGFFIGTAYSAIIESSQLVLSMGECDMADIVANSLGALIGVFIGNFCRRFVKYK